MSDPPRETKLIKTFRPQTTDPIRELAIGLAISLMLASIGALMMGDPAGALIAEIIALTLPLQFFLSHFQLLRINKRRNQ